MSKPPSAANAASTAFESVTSQPLAISSTVTFAPHCLRSATAAAPMPLAPPVTTAILSFSWKSSMRAPVYSARVYDLLIRNATLLDGLGSPPRVGALAVADGKIAAGGEGHGSARGTLHADGPAPVPG